MTAPSLIHVGLMKANAQDASAPRAGHEHPARGGSPPGRARGAVAVVLARLAARLDVERAKRVIA